MGKARSIKNADYPLIGYEYKYLGQPVRVLRVLPTGPSYIPGDSHIEFSTRFDEHDTCEAGKLDKWQDTAKPLTESQRARIVEAIECAKRHASSTREYALAKWQLRRLKNIEKASK